MNWQSVIFLLGSGLIGLGFYSIYMDHKTECFRRTCRDYDPDEDEESSGS